MHRNLSEMVCLITGASSGIGAKLAHQLSERGAKLVLAARRRDKLDALNKELGGGHLCVTANVAETEQCAAVVAQTYDYFGRIDTLVANAGYGISKPTWQHTPAEVRAMFATNVFGTHDLIYFAVPRMLEQPERDGWRGQLMLVSSGAARRGLPFFGPYSGTKAAQLSLAEALRVELKPRGIAVTSVHPVGTRTEFFDVAEVAGGIKVQGIGSRGSQQTPEHVARRMVDAIVKPAREVWPARSFRYLLGLTSMMPGVGDAVMTKMSREIEIAAKS